MAKGNMLQGMARGKVGDVVFSRLNGEQIARVRNRNPKNPRTNAQLYQRAIMATVMTAYSAGKVIFDHSFQGYTVGEANQRRFMSENAKHLRSNLATSVANIASSGVDSSVYGYNAPGIPYPAFSNYKVSEGNLVNSLVTTRFGMPTPLENEKMKDYVSRIGLNQNDLFTFVGFAKLSSDAVFKVSGLPDGVDENPASQFSTIFGFLRLKVKASAFTSETVVTSATLLSTIFDVSDAGDVKLVSDTKIRDEESDDVSWAYNAFESTINEEKFLVSTIIRSRINEDLRSTEHMTIQVFDTSSADTNGITAQYLLDAWKQGAQQIGNSDLILEGGDQ